MHGPDVVELQALLKNRGFNVQVDGVFGPHTAEACLLAKRVLRYPPRERKPIAGEKLFNRLTAAKNLQPPKPSYKKKTQRQKVVDYFQWAIQHEPEIHYAQVRPFPVGKPKALPMRTDCSGFVSLAYRYAGAPDPNGAKWSGLGYTGTLLQHGTKITKPQAKPGDLVVFGPYPGHHVCGVLEAGDDPLLVSHGQEKGPFSIRFSQEQRYQSYPATFIDYLGR
jgi:hypothetical protein